jgi:hypothetical protein
MQAVLDHLTPAEDATLRRLNSLEQLGARLALPMQELKDEIRARDLRAAIREPEPEMLAKVIHLP